MSIVSVIDTTRGSRDSEETAAGKRHARVFHVISDDPNDGPWAARVASFGGESIPSVHDVHPNDPTVWASRVHAKHIDKDPLHFEVTVKYGSRGSGGGSGEEPLLQVATIEANSEHIMKEVTEDINGESIANSCGEPFRGVMVDVTYVSMVVTQYEATYSLADALFYSDRVNSVTWEGLGPNQGKLSDIRGRWVQELGIWQVSYTIKVNQNGWNERLVDRGRQHYLPGVLPKKRVNTLDENGRDTPVDVNLDGFGNVLEDGQPLAYMPDNDDPTKLFEKYREMDFSLIGIRFPWA